MPAYPASAPVSLSPGNQVSLVNNASTDTGVAATIQVSVAQLSPNPAGLMLVNTTNEPVTVQVAIDDSAGGYVALIDGNTATAITCGSGAGIAFACGFPWLRCLFSAAPTSGSLVLCR